MADRAKRFKESFPGLEVTQQVDEVRGSIVDAFRGSWTLKQGQQTLLQRLGPSSAVKRHEHAARARQGQQLKDAVFQATASEDHRGNTRHLGIWHTRFGHLGYTLEHRTALDVCNEFYVWLLDYFKYHIYLRRDEVAADFLDSLDQRIGVPATIGAWLGDDQVQASHHWFTWLAIFDGVGDPCTPPHLDAQDCVPSILVNMEGSAYLVLADYGIRVGLQPGDVVIFRSKELRHCSEPMDGDTGEGRWSVGLFTRQRSLDGEAPTQIAPASTPPQWFHSNRWPRSSH